MDYTPDTNGQEAKKREIETLLFAFAEGRPQLQSSHIYQLIDSFITITPPQNPPLLVHYITIARLGQAGGESRKPGNIILNWKRLFELVPDITIAGAGATEAQWLIPFAALYIWMKLWNVTSVNL